MFEHTQGEEGLHEVDSSGEARSLACPSKKICHQSWTMLRRLYFCMESAGTSCTTCLMYEGALDVEGIGSSASIGKASFVVFEVVVVLGRLTQT